MLNSLLDVLVQTTLLTVSSHILTVTCALLFPFYM